MMWQETTNNLMAGTFGNPVDPQTLRVYWTVMRGLGYPLANVALESFNQRSQELPIELQQAIMQNPQILQQVQQLIQEQQKPNGGNKNVQNS